MKAPKRADSKSDLQRVVETLAIVAFGREKGRDLKPRKLKLDGCSVDVDGYFEADDSSEVILVEAWAHVGKAIGAQPKKVLADVLKLAFVSEALQRDKPSASISKHFLFVDEEAADVLRGKKWGAEAARKFNVVPFVVQLEEAMRTAIKGTQRKQDIRNGSKGIQDR